MVTKVSASPEILWPPNHKGISVQVTAQASDDCGPAPECRIISVSSNEPADGTDDGETAPDWGVTAPLALRLRAERAGGGNGRAYAIEVACTDASGNTATATAAVTVPSDRR